MEGITAGLTGEVNITVRESDLASNYGNPGVEVLSTPRVAALVEEASINAVAEARHLRVAVDLERFNRKVSDRTG